MRKLVLLPGLVLAASLLAAGTASAATEVTVTDQNQHDWEFTSETTTSGHVTFVTNGVQLKTDDNAGKAAGFAAVTGATLKDVAGAKQEPSLRYNSQTGTGPAFQLELSSPTKGWLRLINDPAVNGNKWWATKSCPSCAALLTANLIEDGSTNAAGAFQATLDAWDKAVPDAKVTKIGFALGTGGPLKGVLSQVKFLDATYRFGIARSDVTTTPSTPTPDPTTTPAPAAPAPATSAPRFATCAEASAAGVYNIPASSPDYRTDLDSDSDGLACEQPAGSLNGGSQVAVVPNAIDTGRA